MSKPVLVLDTNVVLDLLHFDDPVARSLLHALETGRLTCAVTDATVDELRRVLAYPEFALEPARQAALLEGYQLVSMAVETVAVGAVLPRWLPRCSDPDDQKFLELAAAVQAQGLVSKDRALLKLRRCCAPRFRIMSPAEAVCWLNGIDT